MQTFLPYDDFDKSMEVLDYRRLCKQRVEAYQILNCLNSNTKAGTGWSNHPAVKMWRGYEIALSVYMDSAIKEWIKRGYKNTMKLTSLKDFKELNLSELPYWFGDKTFHTSHQSNLVRKLPEHYRLHFPDVPDNLPYCWPI